jgi:hypothetical protein
VTIRDIDGLTQPLTRFIRISTVQGVTFQNGSNIVDLLQPFDTFTTTSYNLTTWLPMARIIQGDNSNQSSYLTAYNSLMSTFTFSTVSTNSDLYVRGSTIFYGNVVGLDPLFSSESMSTQQISTGRAIVGQLNAKDTTDPTILALSRNSCSQHNSCIE